MKQIGRLMTGAVVVAVAVGLAGCCHPRGHGSARGLHGWGVHRFGSITGLRAEKAAYYRELHAKAWPGVLARIRASNIRNYSICEKELDGQTFLFSYFEYAGRDFAGDMAAMKTDAETQRWWKETDPCQKPLPLAEKRGEIWDGMEEVFHTAGAVDVKPKQVRRLVAVTGLKPEQEAHYRTLHQTTWPGVLKLIKASNIRNYSIYLKDIGDKLYLFSYLEYVGDNLDADMALFPADPVTLRWWKQTDACQIPLPDAKGIWSDMVEVFHAD